MSAYQDFLRSLLPGNYALTKSMELTRVQNSGTLWYTKKFLTLYYYVFLSPDIMTTLYRQEVIDIFDRYIESLPEEVQDRAKAYFYPEYEAINFKSERFNLFSNFASYHHFATRDEKQTYEQNAKKYYFSLLMGSGGQTGVKKLLKEAVQRPGFVYSTENIDAIILDSAIDVCMREANAGGQIRDNSVKYILSGETMERACSRALLHPVDEADIRQLNEEYPHDNPNYRGIENDMVAFIRNERQILYYYGFFHSKSTGAADFEFSSLTPIGELALQANGPEFLAIWEHQKIKMISQPATADINLVSPAANPAENFGVSYTPYTDILGHLLRRGTLSLEEYKYVVSRKKHHIDQGAWEAEEADILGHLGEIRARVHAFGRQRDRADEDGRKELLKYLLGVRDDLPADHNSNPLGILRFQNSAVSVKNRAALALIYRVYSRLDQYKLLKYGPVLENSEADLKRRYIATVNGEPSAVDGSVKIYWDLYNIHPDTFIMLSVAFAYAAVSLGITDVEALSGEDMEAVSRCLYENFGALFRRLGMRTVTAIRKELQKAVLAIRNEDYSNYLAADEVHDRQVLAAYRTESAADLFRKIQQTSRAATAASSDDRKRNTTLVSLLKSYYLHCYAENGMLRCECCGGETFLTDAGEPYIEFHHLIPFGIAYGPDHYLNLFALCPNCHRKLHFLRTEDKGEKYEALNGNNYLRLSFAQRLRELRAQDLLRSYHLEFLLADRAISLDEYNHIAS